jgi:HAD superfamily hydrolase (TIGR01549 family)
MTAVEFIQANPQFQYLIFDFDSTIAQIQIDWLPWQRLMAEIIQRYEPAYQYSEGRRVDLEMNDYIKKFGSDLRAELWAANQQYEAKNAHGLVKNLELIDFISSDGEREKYLFTSNSRSTIQPFLMQLAIADKFSEVVTRDDVDFVKPDPFGYLRIFTDGHDKTQYLMIGDSTADEGAAQAFGIEFFKVTGVNWVS